MGTHLAATIFAAQVQITRQRRSARRMADMPMLLLSPLARSASNCRHCEGLEVDVVRMRAI